MRRRVLILAVLLVVSGWATVARAELKPDQVVIIAMAESDESRELAQYYAKARGIPESHILLMEGRPEQRITRYQWEETYRPAILEWLKKQEFFANIRCLVTMWDVPLEISAVSTSSPQITERVAFLRQSRASLVRQSTTLIRMLYSASGQTEAARAVPTLADDVSVEELYKQFAAAMKPAQEWLRKAKTPGDQQKAGVFMDRVLVSISGNQGMLRLAAPRSTLVKLTPEQKSRLAYLTGLNEGYQRGMQSLSLLRDTIPRDEQAIELMQAVGGLFGAIRWVDQQLYLLKKNFTAASFDSELSLVLWPDPPLLSWIPNPWHYDFDATGARRRSTLFVSRLSAPAPPIVRRMIDDAIAAEKTSPSGTVYVDARAMTPGSDKPTGNVFTQYDQSLRDLAARLRKHTRLKVVLDDKPEVFELDSCPAAALYCGWHSPGKYVDAFDWVPGSMGYHLSSLEASWLQLNDDNRVQYKAPWCPAILANGACATIGSCGEAYLAAFPLPDDFFSLVLTGKYSLAEAYYRTCPFVSWTVLLMGDPLYNPYKSSPKLSPEALPERMLPLAVRRAAAANRPAAPSLEPSGDGQPRGIDSGTGRPSGTGAAEPPPMSLPGLD